MQLIGGQYQINTFWQEQYCTRHEGAPDTVRCVSCQRMRQRGSIVSLGEDRWSCALCTRMLVRATADAQPLYQSVLAWYREQGMTHPETPPLTLVAQSTLDSSHVGQKVRGAPRERGAPLTHLYGVCCYEVRVTGCLWFVISVSVWQDWSA